jgi:hypothetical protein
MRTKHTIGVAFVFAGVLAVSACGSQTADVIDRPATHPAAVSCRGRSNFELSLVSDRGGQPTPVRAAMWFAGHGGVAGIPRAGWRLTSRTGQQAVAKSGHVIVHVIEGPDRTWQVDSGSTCS